MTGRRTPGMFDPLVSADAHMALLDQAEDAIAAALTAPTEETIRRIRSVMEPLRQSTRWFMNAERSMDPPSGRADFDRIAQWAETHMRLVLDAQEQVGAALGGEPVTTDEPADRMEGWLRSIEARRDAEPLFAPLVSSLRQLVGTDQSMARRRTLADDLDDLREAVRDLGREVGLAARRAGHAARRMWLVARWWWPLRHAGTMATRDRLDPYTLVDIDGERCIIGRPTGSPGAWTTPVVPVRRRRS